jgi:hypothetical protein
VTKNNVKLHIDIPPFLENNVSHRNEIIINYDINFTNNKLLQFQCFNHSA